MGDKTLGINVQMTIDDVTSGLNELIGLFNNIPDDITTNINVNGDALDQANAIKETLDQLNAENINVDANITGDAPSEMETLQSDVNTTISDIQALGPAAEETGNEIIDALDNADQTVNELGTDAEDTSSDLSDTGDIGKASGDEITDSFNEAAIAIGLATAGATEAQNQMYNNAITVGQLANYAEMSNNEMEKLVASTATAKFPVKDVENYVEELDQLGVPNELLKQNAQAMNEIQLGTGASSQSTEQFASVIKELGLNVNDLSSYYGLAGYAQKNVVGGLDSFTSEATVLGPKLEDMGFSAQESTVIIGELSQKYGGNMRGMRSAVTAAKGSQDKLLKGLGTTKSAVDDQVGTFDQYNDTLQKTADNTNKNKSATDDWTYKWDEFTLAVGGAGAALTNLAIAGGVFATIWGGLKLADRILPGDSDLAGKYANFWKSVKDRNFDLVNKMREWWHTDEAKLDLTVPMKPDDKGGYEKNFSTISNFVDDVKAKVGELKDSNIWKMLFGDEKGSLNFNILDEASSKIVSFVDNTKSKLSELKGALSAELDEGYEHYYGGSESSESLDKITGKVKDSVNKVDEFLDEGYEHYYGKMDKVSESSSETLDKITENVESTKNKIGEILDEGYDHYYGKTESFLDDEEGRIKGFNLDDVITKVSSAKDKISEILDEGYEHYYGNNGKAVESNSETLDKITSKFESTKNKISEILDEGYEHYYGKMDKVSESSSETLNKITENVESTKNKIGEILDEGYDHYYGKTESFLDDEEGRIKGFNLDDVITKVSSAKDKISEILDEGYEHYYGNNGKAVESNSETLDKITSKFESTKNKISEFLDEGYEHYYGKMDKVSESSSETLDKITENVESTKNKIGEILDEGYDHYYGKTESFLDDEEGRIKGFNLDDVITKVSSAKDKISEILDEGYEHYYGNNGKAVESNSETLDKITSKFESTKNKISEILDEGYEHYEGDTTSFFDDEEGRIKGIDFDGLINKISTVKDKATDALKYLDELTTYHFNAPGIEEANEAGRDFSYINRFQGTVVDRDTAMDIENYGAIYDSATKTVSDKADTIKDAFSKMDDTLLNGRIKTDLQWRGLITDAYDNEREFSVVVNSFFDTSTKHPYLGSMLGIGDEDIAGIKQDFKATEYAITDGYNNIKTAITKGTDGIKYSEGFTSIEQEMKAFNDSYKKSLGDISEETDRFFGDEKGTVNASMDDLLKTIQSKVISFKQAGGSIVDNLKAGIDEKLPTLDGEGESISDRILAGLNAKLPDFKTEGQQIVASINEGIGSAKVETPTGGTGQTGATWKLPEGYSSGSTERGAYKLPDGNEILPPESETKEGKENVGWLGDSNGLGGIVDKLKTWTTIPKFNAASLGRGVLSVLGDAEMLPMMAGTTLADMNPVKHNLTPEEQKVVDERNQKSIQEENDRPSFQQQVGAIGNALFPKTSSDAIVKPYQDAIDKVKNIKMPSLSGLQSSIGSSLGGLGTYIKSHLPKIPTISWDTIKQGLAGPVTWVEGEVKKFKDWITSHLPKLPTLNWDTIKQGLAAPVQWVETQYNNFKQWIISHTPKIPTLTWGNLSQGFWDIVNWVETEYEGLKQWVTNHIPKIPVLPWGNLTQGLQGIVDWITQEVNNLLATIRKLPGASALLGGGSSGGSGGTTGGSSGGSSWASSLMGAIGSGIKTGASLIMNPLGTIASWFPHSPPQAGPLATITTGNMSSWAASIAQSGVSGFSQLGSGLSGVLGSAVSVVDSKFNQITNSSIDFLGSLSSVSDNIYSVGSSMVDNLTAGISSGMGSLDAVFNEISGMFPHSPPKSGPLSTITTANMKSWATSVADAGVEGFSKLNEYANSKIQIPNVPNIPTSPIPGSNQSGQTVIYLEVAEGAVLVQGNATKDVIDKGGSIFGTSLAGTLKRQAGAQGVNVINNMG